MSVFACERSLQLRCSDVPKVASSVPACCVCSCTSTILQSVHHQYEEGMVHAIISKIQVREVNSARLPRYILLHSSYALVMEHLIRAYRSTVGSVAHHNGQPKHLESREPYGQ